MSATETRHGQPGRTPLWGSGDNMKAGMSFPCQMLTLQSRWRNREDRIGA
jgi:hypothetical protein